MIKIFGTANNQFYINPVCSGHKEDFTYVKDGDNFTITKGNTGIEVIKDLPYTEFIDDLDNVFATSIDLENYIISQLVIVNISINVIDNLISTDTESAGSANQLRVLDEKISANNDYNNTISGLTSNDFKDAIDELAVNKVQTSFSNQVISNVQPLAANNNGAEIFLNLVFNEKNGVINLSVNPSIDYTHSGPNVSLELNAVAIPVEYRPSYVVYFSITPFDGVGDPLPCFLNTNGIISCTINATVDTAYRGSLTYFV